MIEMSVLTLFIPASLLLIIAPGPDILFVVTQGISSGRKAGFFTALGLVLGNSVHTMAAALGVSLIFRSSVFAFALLAADVSGKWTSTMQGRDGKSMETTFTFKVDGDKLTGTRSGRGGDRGIADGKINGDEISFSVTTERNGNTMKQNYKGTVSGDEIKFKQTA